MLDSRSMESFTGSWRFSGHAGTLVAHGSAEVAPLLAEVERQSRAGLHAVGFVAYEAASPLNPDLPPARGLEGLPLAWFSLYRERHAAPPADDSPCVAEEIPPLEPAISPAAYAGAVESIRARIAAGESYQVNYTFPMTGEFGGDPLPLYRRIVETQKPPFAAYLDTGRFVILSASPELFFSRVGDEIVTRPMKGTAPRGRWTEEDRALAAGLLASPKERAENLMIVDLLRNDLGIVAETGTVRVDSLFAIERYPTVQQMTSTVSARLKEHTGLAEIFRALFPCGSVTGAPKRRSMEIIGELEPSPRGVYCGAIGMVSPDGEACFSVAIRTLLLDRATSSLTLSVGSGITWDSRPEDEYRECLGKGAFLRAEPEPFRLIETMGLEEGRIPRLERHLARMERSAEYFAFPFDRAAAMELLAGVTVSGGTLRLRLTLDGGGKFGLTTSPLEDSGGVLRLGIASPVIDPSDPFRYHKTTRREILERGRLEVGDCDEVVFVNSRGELTEGSYHNLVLRLDGRLLTPPLECGLLPGILREELLESGEITEALLLPADLQRAEEIWLINSLRGWRRAVLKEDLP